MPCKRGLLLALLGWNLLMLQNAFGQVTSANILGDISDPSGAPITGAKITVKNEATGDAYSAETNGAGNYVVPSLPINGSYTVQIEANGFQSYARTGIVIQINQNTTTTH